MTLPWGVKDFIEPDHAEAFKAFIETIKDAVIELPSDNHAKILKADVKEKKDKFLMILRYQLETWSI